jgi:hypothetical protein
LSIWHWVILGLFALAIFVVYRTVRQSARNASIEGGPVGVGGWLALLVLGLVVLGPLFNAARINGDLLDAERQYPQLSTMPAWLGYKSGTWITYFAITALSVWAGVGLYRQRGWSAVRRAKIILWIIGPAASIVLGVLLPIVCFGRSAAGEAEFVGSLIASVLVASIWTAYLARSKRVRNTYPRESDSPSPLSARQVTTSESQAASVLPVSMDDKLRELRKLYDAGLISQEIYLERQRLLLDGKALR